MEGGFGASESEAAADAGVGVDSTTPAVDGDVAQVQNSEHEGSAQESVAAALAALEMQTGRFHERAERQEQIIRTMQERIVQLQGDQMLSLLKPALLRFAALHAQAQEAAETARDRGEKAANDLAFFATTVDEALGLLDLDSVGAVTGAAFDGTRHSATGAVPTADPHLDRTIVRVVRQGFSYPDVPRATIPAQVTVYRYDAALAPVGMEPGAATHAMPVDDRIDRTTSAESTEGH